MSDLAANPMKSLVIPKIEIPVPPIFIVLIKISTTLIEWIAKKEQDPNKKDRLNIINSNLVFAQSQILASKELDLPLACQVLKTLQVVHRKLTELASDV